MAVADESAVLMLRLPKPPEPEPEEEPDPEPDVGRLEVAPSGAGIFCLRSARLEALFDVKSPTAELRTLDGLRPNESKGECELARGETLFVAEDVGRVTSEVMLLPL